MTSATEKTQPAADRAKDSNPVATAESGLLPGNTVFASDGTTLDHIPLEELYTGNDALVELDGQKHLLIFED